MGKNWSESGGGVFAPVCTHSGSRSATTASLARQTTSSLKRRKREKKKEKNIKSVSDPMRGSANVVINMGQSVVVAALTIAPGVPFSPGAPASP